MAESLEDALIGSLLATAVGDALGLPFEGMSRRRAEKYHGSLNAYSFLGSYGMLSDDSEHACITAQSLICSGGDLEKFARDLSRRLRWWLLALPAGTGRATLFSIVKMWLGFSWKSSGVFSAGNGPAMRSAIIGLYCQGDSKLIEDFVNASAVMTHSDPKASIASFAIAWAASRAMESSDVQAPEFVLELREILGKRKGFSEFDALLEKVLASVEAGESSVDFACSIGQGGGVSGYIYATVPVVLQTWLRHQGDLEGALKEVICCGGDSDSTAAILGSIIGARVGLGGISDEWLDRLLAWPMTVSWIKNLGKVLTEAARERESKDPRDIPFIYTCVRNAVFFVLVLSHGFRRLLPPY